jgi:hypothetical protein
MRLFSLLIIMLFSRIGLSQSDTIWQENPKDTIWLIDPKVDTTVIWVKKVELVSPVIKSEIEALLQLRPTCVDNVDFKVELIVKYFNRSSENEFSHLLFFEFAARNTIFSLGVTKFFLVGQDTVFYRNDNGNNFPEHLIFQDSSQDSCSFKWYSEFEYYYQAKPGSMDDFDMDVVYVSELDLLPRMFSFPWAMMEYDFSSENFKLQRKEGCPEMEDEE